MLLFSVFLTGAVAVSVPYLTTRDNSDYNGDLRPQMHYSPPTGFMNDPNGCFLDWNGLWHLYYQYNPTGLVAGNQHWGHATSNDLYHWKNQNIALSATDPQDQIFSGSIVVDETNTSGLFNNLNPGITYGVVAIYTLNTPQNQTQCIAYSVDGGYTFEEYSNNPVIDSSSTQFRDPKVIWYNGHWVMVVAYSQDFTIGFWTSPDLIHWTATSNFTHQGLLGLQWECPNLVEMPVEGSTSTMWVLAISINPGAPVGGSIMQYFPGTFDGTQFKAVDGVTRIADFGKDNYAGQFFYGVDPNQDQVMIAWASNWQYCDAVPTDSENWRSAMTIPRRMRLRNVTRLDYDLISLPYGLTKLNSTTVFFADPYPPPFAPLSFGPSQWSTGALYFAITVFSIPIDGTATGTLNFTFSSSTTGETVSAGYFFGGDVPFWIDRGGVTGFNHPLFTNKFSTNALVEPWYGPSGQPSGEFEVEVLFDRTIMEVFLNHGQSSATTVFYPKGRLDTLTITPGGLSNGTTMAVGVLSYDSMWNT